MGRKPNPSLPPGVPTQAEIAELAQVSRRSVYNYLQGKAGHLSPDVRERLERIITETGYRTPYYIDLLRNKRPSHVAVVVGQIHNEFYTQFLTGFLGALNDRGLQGILVTGAAAEQVDILVAEKRFGSVFSMYHHRKESHLAAFTRHGVPWVEFEGQSPGAAATIHLDHKSHMEQVARFVHGQGFRRLATFGGGSSPFPPGPGRIGHLYQTAIALGMESRPDWFLAGSDDLATAYESTCRLFADAALAKPDVIFTHNDHTAMAVLAALRDCNVKVPEEVGVVGQDGVASAAFFRPSLTTLDFELGRMVTLCADTQAKIHLEGATGLRLLHTGKLVPRDSTRRNPRLEGVSSPGNPVSI